MYSINEVRVPELAVGSVAIQLYVTTTENITAQHKGKLVTLYTEHGVTPAQAKEVLDRFRAHNDSWLSAPYNIHALWTAKIHID